LQPTRFLYYITGAAAGGAPPATVVGSTTYE